MTAPLRTLTHSIPPVKDAESRMLFLGSFPSVASHEKGFYYMHPQNRFWKVLSALFNEDFDVAPQQKIPLLLKHNIALYDSVESCSIYGSSDSKMNHIRPADIAALMAGTKIEKIFLVGARSAEVFKKSHPNLMSIAVVLPSPSPANAAFNLTRLTEAWRAKIFG